VKNGVGSILRPEQERYLERLLPPREPLLREMEEQAARGEVPISDPETGRLLSILARAAAANGARLILEIAPRSAMAPCAWPVARPRPG
jgi:predicted O-methyltransferase YrrM